VPAFVAEAYKRNNLPQRWGGSWNDLSGCGEQLNPDANIVLP